MTRYPIVFIAIFATTAATAVSISSPEASTQPPAVCTLHENMESYTLDRIAQQLDSSSAEPEVMAFLDSIGVAGVSSVSATVVRDSAKCAAARLAYASLYFAAEDSLARSGWLSQVTGVFVVRLTPNRYVVNAGMADLWRVHHMFVLDSTWSLVSNHF